MTPTLKINNLSCSYSLSPVLDDISTTFSPGERVLLLGANGSGKTTLLRCIAGLDPVDSGSIEFNVKTSIGHLSHYSYLYHQLTVEENIRFFGNLQSKEVIVEEELVFWGLTPYSHMPISELSAGLRQKVSLCRVFLENPDILLLDEPTTALDDTSSQVLKKKVLELPSTTVAILTSHDLTRVWDWATRVILLHQGKIVEDSCQTSADQCLKSYHAFNR